ncbi:SDR family NAD(P)-dependent oxidoreductase [Brucella tritici]|uniref:SDR family NAD(P)-dependent oxidoreductase n=1 Tax=Brucella tritici TaxID=94626 RepID=A0A6L3Y3I4_9HYPH|nr:MULTISPECIES: SDR family NAD(P)-dependent oxidoreductase [Brucella]KAB2669865.1 SDR family NAD(P)-dependent oxidoreductase [Brucella tritici]KAB2675957.1 SDR family NAD(P)-dependent oxidoreductase [Brucella tritici]MCH4543902.1 SDR family NAD(P)-dependent oxidoreductase [Ochrobactrum sp. A-1]RRY15969.1 SDR family NAD(P)-dependent oxidoreductase [Brucella anthropi]
MAISFENRVVIVTGAGGGLGRAYALELAARGAKVVVNDFGGSRDGTGGASEAAEKVVAEIRSKGGVAIADAGNVTKFEDMQALAKHTVEEFGRIDILINNAGILRDKSFAKMEMCDFGAVVDVHLIGSANASRAVWDIMKGQNYGRILMTTSTSGVYGNFGQSNYGAAKAGLVGLMNVLHFEGDKYDIHVNAIAPTAATRMTGDVLDEEMLVRLAPENVVPAALFLVSEQAPSRTVLLAGAGTVARMAIVESEGVYLPKSERTPEAVAAAFTKIDDMTNFIETDAGLAHVDRIIATSRANEVIE